MPGLRILVVDDHEDSACALGKLLRHRGHTVTAAHTGIGALALSEGLAVDVVISDLDLPDGNGCELFRRLRASHPLVRGIAISGYDSETWRERCREAGFEHLIAKPVGFETLLAAIDDSRRSN